MAQVQGTLIYVDLRGGKNKFAAFNLRASKSPAVIYDIDKEKTRVMCDSPLTANYIKSIFPVLTLLPEFVEGYPVLECSYEVLTDVQIRDKLREKSVKVKVIKW